MNAVVEQLTVRHGQRAVVMSDIHGHSDWFDAICGKVRLCDDDLLILCGDLIEKGPDSLALLRKVMRLRERMDVKYLMGNNDNATLWALESPENFVYAAHMRDKWAESIRGRMGKSTYGMASLLNDMLAEMGEAPQDDDPLPQMRRVEERFAEEIAYLRSLPTVLSSPKYLFVHAGLPTRDESDMPNHPAQSFIKNDEYWKRHAAMDKWLVVGHWPTSLNNERYADSSPIVDATRRLISIDGGCVLKGGGQLNALLLPDLNSDDFTFAIHDDYPRAVALDAQPESATSFNLRWIDNEIDILSEANGVARIRHLRTGYEMSIPSARIYSRATPARCADATDYRPAIAPGDTLSLLSPERTPLGWFVKIKGREGWYVGNIRR